MNFKGLLKNKKVLGAAVALAAAVIAALTGWETAAELLCKLTDTCAPVAP